MYTMMQVCRELDMTYQTLKFYCNEKDVKWMKDLTCLKNVANAALTLTWMPGILLRADGYETSFYKKY